MFLEPVMNREKNYRNPIRQSNPEVGYTILTT